MKSFPKKEGKETNLDLQRWFLSFLGCHASQHRYQPVSKDGDYSKQHPEAECMTPRLKPAQLCFPAQLPAGHISPRHLFFFVMLIKYTHAIPTFLLQNYRKQAEEEAGRASGWQPVLWRARKFLCLPLTEMKTTAECSGLHYSFTRPLYIIIPKCIHLARSSFPKHLSIANNCPPSSHTHNVLFFVRRTRLVMNSAPSRQVQGLFGHQA